MRGVFLIVSKVFDEVWCKGIIFKLKQNSKLLSELSDILKNRKQGVSLNRQISLGASINAGAPHGSVLCRLTLRVYIKNLVDGSSLNTKFFADDTSLFSVIHDADTAASKFISSVLYQLNKLTFQKKMNLNPDRRKRV